MFIYIELPYCRQQHDSAKYYIMIYVNLHFRKKSESNFTVDSSRVIRNSNRQIVRVI